MKIPPESPVEQRIARACEGLAPSPALADEILSALPEQRAAGRRPRMRRAVVAAVVVACAVAGAWFLRGEHGPEHLAGATDTMIELPVVPAPTDAGPDAGGPSGITVRIDAEGHVHLSLEELGGRWTRVDRGGLGAYLEHATTGSEEVKPSRLSVLLEADGRAQWSAVQKVILACAERGIGRLSFAGHRADGRRIRLDAALPEDRGIEEEPVAPPPPEEGPPPPAPVSVQVRRAPTGDAVLYRMAGRETRDISTLERWLSAAWSDAPEATRPRVAEIDAAPDVPFRHVAALLAAMRCGGARDVLFTMTAQPSSEPPETSRRDAEPNGR